MKPALSIGLHGINVDPRFMDVAAFGTPQGPVLKAGPRWNNALDCHAGWHLGQRDRLYAARGGNSGGDDCRSDMALI
jgi:hypothetical protein